ncbi:hypothetical protein EYF80_009006 [Liparis tanakae]|uniref:Uncharacterized protein n=1 Tax=Liparis tanakae TaxID=230148 RepID=A0A4Z2ITY1_9TELE|nr:hypothetical protein EYF80_009006 [Liparis tanakae]
MEEIQETIKILQSPPSSAGEYTARGRGELVETRKRATTPPMSRDAFAMLLPSDLDFQRSLQLRTENQTGLSTGLLKKRTRTMKAETDCSESFAEYTSGRPLVSQNIVISAR